MVRSITTMLNEWLARLQFWWAKKTLKEGRDFAFNKDFTKASNGLIIEIMKPPYNDIVVQVSGFKVREVAGHGLIDFETRVLYNVNDVDVTTDKFNKLIANIVRFVIQNSLDTMERVDPKDLFNEDRDDDIVELDEERPVSTEVSAVPEKRVPKRKPRKKTVSRDTKILPKVQQPTKSKRPKSPSGRQKRPD